jgi:hypothetical protein
MSGAISTPAFLVMRGARAATPATGFPLLPVGAPGQTGGSEDAMRLTNHLISEIRIGQSAELRRLVTIDDLWSFASISGNVNPMNLPGQDNDADGQPDNGAPGMFLGALISAVPGTMLPGRGRSTSGRC